MRTCLVYRLSREGVPADRGERGPCRRAEMRPAVVEEIRHGAPRAYLQTRRDSRLTSCIEPACPGQLCFKAGEEFRGARWLAERPVSQCRLGRSLYPKTVAVVVEVEAARDSKMPFGAG